MNAVQLKDFATKMIEGNYPFVVAGAPGVGKTQIFKALGKELNRKVWISHPVLDDPTDYKGLPWMTQDENDRTIADFLPIGIINQMLDFPSDELGLWIIDDGLQATTAVQGALMQWFSREERELNGRKLGDNISIVMLTNEKTHGAGVTAAIEPLKGRAVAIVRLEPDLPSWIDWALAHSIDMRIITYLSMVPHALSMPKVSSDLENTPNPRTWNHASYILGMGLEPTVELEALSGAIGRPVASELAGFLRIHQEMPNPISIKTDPTYREQPKSSNASFALTGSLARSVTEAELPLVLNYMDEVMKQEFRRLWCVLFNKVNKELTKTEAYTNWAVANQDIL